MRRFFSNKKGQNTAEYAILIGLVIAAAIAMQTYVKRGLQGGIKFAVDKAGKSAGRQYEPYYLESSYDRSTSAYKDTEETKTGGAIERVYGTDDSHKKTVTSSGYQTTGNTSQAD